MSAVVVFVVAAGIIVAAALGAAVGLDLVGVILLALVVGLGALAIVTARRARTGAVAPGRCTDCGGLISPNAPYCKHCGCPEPRG